MPVAALDTRHAPPPEPPRRAKPLRALPAPPGPRAELAPPEQRPVLLVLRPDEGFDTPRGSAIRREEPWPY